MLLGTIACNFKSRIRTFSLSSWDAGVAAAAAAAGADVDVDVEWVKIDSEVEEVITSSSSTSLVDPS